MGYLRKRALFEDRYINPKDLFKIDDLVTNDPDYIKNHQGTINYV